MSESQRGDQPLKALARKVHRLLARLLCRPLLGFAVEGPPNALKLACLRWIVLPGLSARDELVEYDVHPGVTFRGRTTDFLPLIVRIFHRWEPTMTAFITSRLETGRVMLDVGANIGWFDLVASPLVGADGVVVAIEASPAIFRRLSEQIERNRLTNVRLVNEAAGAEEGWVQIIDGPEWNSAQSSVSPDVERPGAVRCRPLDQIVTADEITRCRVVKIDVEGAEYEVVRGIGPLLDALPPDAELVVEVGPGRHGFAAPTDEFWQTFTSRGFRAYEMPNEYTPAFFRDPVIPKELSQLASPPRTQTDVVFSRIAGDTLTV